jgi:hypothetical protein
VAAEFERRAVGIAVGFHVGESGGGDQSDDFRRGVDMLYGRSAVFFGAATEGERGEQAAVGGVVLVDRGGLNPTEGHRRLHQLQVWQQ